MKKGQTTLEYVYLIGIVAAGLIAVIVYVSRGHQGNLRSQAQQLGAGQYAPGNTVISNNEIKNLTSIVKSKSTTTTSHPEHPVDEPYPLLLKQLSEDIRILWGKIYLLMGEYEAILVLDGIDEAEKARNNLPPTPSSDLRFNKKLDELKAEEILRDAKLQAVEDIFKERDKHPREPDATSTVSESSESGQTITHKEISETLGDL